VGREGREEYIGRRVWTILKGDTFLIECGKEEIARYEIKPGQPFEALLGQADARR
jgi:hypothetical protein